MKPNKAQKKEQLALEKISKENLVLNKTLKRRTKELEQKNRELQIEAALEKVRARSMAMQHSDELQEVINSVYNRLIELGIEIHACTILTPAKNPKELMGWFASGTQEYVKPIHMLNHGNVILEDVWNGFKNTRELFSKTYSFKEKNKLFNHIFEHSDFKNISEDRKQLVIESKAYTISNTFMGYSGIQLNRYSDKQFSKQENEILIRFGKVFEQTYTRFLDLQKAEAHAREAEIELALEKVRARTMAMQHSDDLQETSFLLDQQVRALGIKTWGCAFNIYGEKESTEWFSGAKGIVPPYKTPKENVFKRYYDLGQKGETFYKEEYADEACVALYEYLCTLPEAGKAVRKIKEEGGSFPTRQIAHVAYFKQGYLLFITLEDVPEAYDIFKRFAKVFEQTYTRFLDLQKAEAQAWEAEIELALERVRARTMAMQHSNELAETASLLFQQVSKLGVELWGCSFNIWEPGDTSFTSWWGGRDLEIKSSWYIPLTEHAIFMLFDASRKRGDKLWVEEAGGEKLATRYQYMLGLPDVGNHLQGLLKTGITFPTFQIDHIVNFSHGNVLFITYEPCPEAYDIFKRFAKVFEQTYTRFLDLQKAEKQARKAQIEAALEKVRSRSLAMHKSDELQEVINTIYDRLIGLDIKVDSVNFTIFSEGSKDFTLWTGVGGKFYRHPQHMPYIDFGLTKDMWVAIEDGQNFFSKQYSFEKKNKWWSKAFEVSDLKHIPKDRKKLILKAEGYTVTMAIEKFSCLQLNRYSNELFTEIDQNVTKRFAKVFEQAYIRFLDLQKAEEQAREAQIQLALERVRARTMAMQHSDELKVTSELLFQQIKELGIESWSCGYTLWHDDDSYCIGYNSGPFGKMSSPFKIPLTEDIFFKTIRKAKRKGEEFFVFESKGKSLVKTYKYMDSLPVVGDGLRDIVAAGFALPTFQVTHCGFFPQGHLMFITQKQYPEAHDIFKRFTKEFEQTYTRFLDLQKAEAQAREAQIETALERVRSRSMAMHKSEELADLSFELVKQIQALGVPTWFCAFNIYGNDPKGSIEWGSNAEGVFPKYRTPREGIFLRYYKAGQRGESLLINEIGEKECSGHYEYLSTLPIVGEQILKMKEAGIPFPTSQIDHVAFFKYGYILFITVEPAPESHEVFKRFAKVFQQTYTRFLDLQKAEAQAREARIEAALEKVRSRSLAMRQSPELLDVITEMYLQLEVLDITLDSCYINIFKDENPKDIIMYIAAGSKTYKETFINNPIFTKLLKARENKDNFFSLLIDKKQTIAWWKQFFSNATNIEVPRKRKNYIAKSTGMATSVSLGKYAGIHMARYAPIPYLDEENQILMRFGKVFDQVYTRFLDLQKAEAQAREAQIENALEKVRSRSLAMRQSEELLDVITEIFLQLEVLEIPLDSCFINIYRDETPKDMTAYIAAGGRTYRDAAFLPFIKSPMFTKLLESRKNNESFYSIKMDKKDTVRWWKHFFSNATNIKVPRKRNNYIAKSPGLATSVSVGKYASLHMMRYVPTPYSDEENQIFMRFGKVFDQVYTRFLDLQKAEAQAREAQIEASLERVRSQAMAMRQSDDLVNCTSVVFDELEKLNLSIERSGIGIFDPETKDCKLWSIVIAEDGTKELATGITSLTIHPMLIKTFDSWGTQKSFTYVLEGKELEHYYKLVANSEFILSEEVIGKSTSLPKEYYHYSPFAAGGLYFFSDSKPVDEDKLIIRRFAEVFDLTYTRYEDLQKAEEQAREAQIEAALEKVRSRTMGMQKSEELSEVNQVIYEQLIELNFNIDAVGFAVDHRKSDDWDLWQTDSSVPHPYQLHIPYFDHPLPNAILEAKKNGLELLVFSLTFNEKNKMLDQFFKYVSQPQEVKKALYGFPGYVMSKVLLKNVDLYIHRYTGIPFTNAENAILIRFTKVFEQTYTRFNDLKQAEEQAKEAEIETSLERIRSRSMAMQDSSELNEILATVFEELLKLNIDLETSIIWIFNLEDRSVRWWQYNPEDESGIEGYLIPYLDHEVYHYHWKAWEERRNKDLYILEGKNKETWDDVIFSKTELSRTPKDVQKHLREVEKGHLNNTFHDFGLLMIGTREPLSEDKFSIIERFGKVFDQSYTRFEDVQKAEIRAKEVLKQSSLDRLRAKIASMRTATDLEQIIPSIWKELDILGVPFIRCGVFITNEENQSISTYLSAPDGQALAAFELPYDINEVAVNIVLNWKKKETYQTSWSKKEFLAFMKDLGDQGLLKDPLLYQGAENPPDYLYLNFAPFKQGMLYVGNIETLSTEHIELVQALANAFSIAYARYEDFNQLEEAKKSVDDSLTELKQTQQQLVQSEKMASLGELTAGIAHEIQNPLNFVNNFSEVSKELLEEMLEEMESGDIEEVKAIADDLIQNLEKITHHGKRADGIVKGMLQHSRSSTGKKEPTDINTLADEYLRLAYHGLRAKDKTFNAQIVSDFDPDIKTIDIIPQDMGRVILNLLTNAFYVVNEKKKENIEGYEPTVSISTKKKKDLVEIKVSDNGNGIPKKVIDKIFQPFFTTKPTGQGTGLGLSMSYDIITKGHGGKLIVETKKGKGAEFIIHLPSNN